MVSLELFCNLVPNENMTQRSSESHTEGLSLLTCPTLFQSFYIKKKEKIKGNMIYYLFKGINKKSLLLI